MMMVHIVFDVDGTLSDFHGDIKPELCVALRKKGAWLWMLSKRDRDEEAKAICEKYRLMQAPMVTGKDYVDIKIGSLKKLMNDHIPRRDKVVYVGDRAEDFVVAWMCDAVYCSPSALSLDIFQEVLMARGVMCGGECGPKTFFRGNLIGVL